MHNTLALFITFLLGFFIIIGVIIAFFLKKQKKVLDFIFAFALSILTMLILTDLLGHTIEHLGIKHIYLFILFTCLGLLIFKIIDDFVPEHEDAKMTKKEEKKNIVHIGVLATIALIIHNFVEGMAIYLTSANDINLGIMMALGVGLHNIPLGIIITTTLNCDKNTGKYLFCIISLFISSFLGGLLLFLLNINTVSDIVIGSLLALTIGMLLYIIIFELYPKVKKTTNKKITIIGLVTGVIIALIGMFIG